MKPPPQPAALWATASGDEFWITFTDHEEGMVYGRPAVASAGSDIVGGFALTADEFADRVRLERAAPVVTP